MELRLLGPVEARLDGHSIALGAPKQRAVLAMLALEVGRTVSVDRLAEGLWGEQPPTSAPKMVQLYVSHLRRLLEGNGAQIVTRGRGYELQLADGEVDAVRFEQLVEQSRAREALALWRGAALADVADEPFAAAEIRRLDELRLRAAEEAIDADLAAGRHREVIGELEALIAEHPLRERLHSQRMLALYRAGRQAEALGAYREARTVLVDQIGVEPGAELRRLQEAILDQDPALDAPVPPPEPVPEAARPPPRRVAPVLAIAGLLLFAGVIAFGISRVMQPDSLSGIDENFVGRIDADSGRITAPQYPVGHGPEAMVGGAGSVWVANRLDGTVSRIDREQIVQIDVGGEPTGLAFGAGSLWVANGQGRTVAQIDPDTNKVEATPDVGNAAHAVAVRYGAVWVASAVDATVVRIDLDSGDTRRIPVDPQPSALAAGSRAIWVASDATGRVTRLDPRTGTALAPIRVGNGPSGIAVGAGAVWVANRRDGTVTRIDPATEVTETVRVGREPSAVAADEHGVWVANAGDGTLMRIDPRSRRATRTIPVGSSPAALAVVDGDVWTSALAATPTHRGGTLRVSISTGPDYPFEFNDLGYDRRALLLAGLVYDGLVGYRRAGGSAGATLVPNLARNVPEPSADGRTYLFRLRPDLRFSNGAPVTPEDVRASFERVLGADGYQGYIPIRRIETDPIARTVTVHLSRTDVDFLHKLPIVSVVQAGSTTRPLPGTGPYIPARSGKERVQLVRNPHFRVWSPDARPDGFPDQIEARLEPPKAEIAAVDAGAADAALFYHHQSLAAQLQPRYGSRLHTDPGPTIWYAFLNTRAPPFDDVRVRRALNYAVDRARVAELFGTHQTHVPTCQLLPPGTNGYTPSCPFTANPNPAGTWSRPDMVRARRLVAASGTRGMKVEIWGSVPWESVGPYFASVLSRLGYRSRVRTFDDLHEIIETAAHRSPQLGLWGWSAESAAPYSFLSPLVSCAAEYNLSRFCVPELDARMEKAGRAQGPEATELWQSVEASLATRAPTVPLVSENFVSLAAKDVGNYQHHPVWGPLLDQLWAE